MMAFKKRAVGTATTAVSNGPRSVPVPAAEVIHMMKEVTTKTGGAPRVKVLCGLEGTPYRGKGRDGLRTSIWSGEVTCRECWKQPSVNLWRKVHNMTDETASTLPDEDDSVVT